MKKFFIYFLAFILMISSGRIYINPDNTGYYCETYFSDSGTTYYNEEETISYDSYTVTEEVTNHSVPNYTNLTQLNSCAPMAGTIVLAYYDYYYPELIPDYATSYVYNNKFYYRGQSDTINTLKEHLYDLMGTNSIKPGTSIFQFKVGMTSYSNTASYTIAFDSLGDCSNLTQLINKFRNNIPVVVFMNSYDYTPFAGLSITDTEMTQIKRISSNGHVAVACGYREYNFFNDGVNFRTDKYLLVAFGNGTLGMLKINDTSKIDEGIAITFSV